METIRNYLESMFKNLPQTEAVIKAKYELGQMMEDKYVELIKEGKTESEAVGTVISEFGNLDELAAELGIEDVLQKSKTSNINRRKVTLDEAKSFLRDVKIKAILRAVGVALCISCVTGPILADAINTIAYMPGVFGVFLMFASIASAVALFIISNSIMENHQYLMKEPCSLEPSIVQMIKNKKRDFSPTYSIMTSVGVLLIILCIMPPIVLDEFDNNFFEELSGAFFFWFIASGVALIIVSREIKRGYEKLLSLNASGIQWPDFMSENSTSASAAFAKADAQDKVKYKNKTARTIMEVYWPLMTCAYLCWSFLTYKWYITWIIWPIAGVMYPVVKSLCTEGGENE